MNFSTRPAVSINFCLPVKKGWHEEQIATVAFSGATVDVAGISAPHAHLKTTLLTLGWISFFIYITSGIIFYNGTRVISQPLIGFNIKIDHSGKGAIFKYIFIIM